MSISINPLPGQADNPFVLTAEAKKDMLLTSIEEWRWILVGLLAKIQDADLTTATATLHAPTLLGASASVTIPAGAKGYQISILTGTATVKGTALIPAGVTISSDREQAASITVTTAAASSALVVWET